LLERRLLAGTHFGATPDLLLTALGFNELLLSLVEFGRCPGFPSPKLVGDFSIMSAPLLLPKCLEHKLLPQGGVFRVAGQDERL
jgi:hypothetical protein